MRFEFDSVVRVVSYLGKEDGIDDFRCVNDYEYRELCEIILSKSQFDRHIALSFDGIYNVSRKRYLKGVEYKKDNVWLRQSR